MSSQWNHGKISRNAAEQLLVANGKNGAFLVRESESVNDAHVLSLWFDGMVHHFRILRKENMFVVQAAQGSITRMFTTLEDVIELFKQPGQGLPHVLVEPISNIVNEMEHDSDDELDQEKDMVDGRMEPVEECMDISIQLINRLAQMNYSGLGNDFCSKVQCYLNGGFDRDGKRMSGSEPATDLQDLIVNCAEGVKRELKEFLKKIVFLQELFCTDDDLKRLVPGGLSSGHSSRQSNDVSPYDDLVQDLAICVAGIKSLEMLAQKSYQEQAGLMKDEQSQTRTFEVTSCGNFKTRSYLKVDITEGKLLIMKNENEPTTDSTTVEHDKILQLVKDPSMPKLTLKIAKGNKEYLFKDIQAREYLCQLVQHMMNTHDPNKKEPKEISIFVGTWNMGSATPQNIESWLKCEGTGEIRKSEALKLMGHDIYAIGTQESSVSEASWVSKIKMALKKQFIVDDYKTVAVYSLWGIRLVILAKAEHRNRISRIEKSSVKTGIANTLGNKGGVGISFDFLSTSLCFINCHLTSGNEDLRKQRRQQNYMDILKGLNLGHKTAYDLTNQFHHVFWFGDLNYRIDMQYEEIIEAVQLMDYKVLADNDQLKKEKDLGNVFVNFHENVPHFPPTYRYKRGNRESYEHIKVKRAAVNRINVPSWCDRVLWRSFPDLTVEQQSYGCTNDIVTSDHSPVFASFDVPIKSQIGASPDKERPNLQANKPLCKIHIPFIKVKIKTVSKTDFYLEFHSVCLVSSERSKPGKQSSPWDPPRTVNSNPTLTSYLEWVDPCSLPELNPIFDNPDYLREQHILIAVKSENGDESYGECVVSLKGHLFNTPQKFESDLTHGGIKAGEIKGRMNLLNAKQAVVSRRPPVHAKPDLGIGAKLSSHRPFSCVAPNVTETIPTSLTKSSSLGRASTKRGYPVQPPQDTSQISTYAEIHDFSPTTESDNPLYEAMTSQSSEPPPLPAKMHPSKTSTLPSTVGGFLSKIGLQDYLSNLCDNGFDNIIFLDQISDEDLADSGITNSGHVRKILDEVENLRKAGAFNS